MRNLVKLMLERNSPCKRIKNYSTSILKNSSHDYASSRKYHFGTKISSCCFTSCKSAANSFRQASTCPLFQENPQGQCYQAKETEGEGERDVMIKKRDQMFERILGAGDVVDLNDLLFTKDRDYLIRYNDDRHVKASELEGKVVVLDFVALDLYLQFEMRMSDLIDTYTYLLPYNVFEVVFIPYIFDEEEETTAAGALSSDSVEKLKEIFSSMPWTAIPFSDITSREYLVTRFGVRTQGDSPIIIGSNRMVLKSYSGNLFKKYGGLGYPFSDERIKFLESQDNEIANNPTVEALLASPQRNYLISNKGDKVLIDTLKEKVVALYFYAEGVTSDYQTADIKAVYEELAQLKKTFEVVLIYLYDTYRTYGVPIDTSEESFYNTFKTMPWLALPYKDSKCRDLKRLFHYPEIANICNYTDPTLVIIEPNGDYVEPWGADIIRKFRLSAYPFTREKVAYLDITKIMELKLEMLWDPNTLFTRKDGFKVQFSQLVGKRIIIFFEGDEEEIGDNRKERVTGFLNLLKEKYHDMKGTSDEFEVIYVTSSKEKPPHDDHIAFMPWFVSPASDLLPIDISSYCCYCHLLPESSYYRCRYRHRHRHHEWESKSSILAFDRDGSVVRKSTDLSFDGVDFPFYYGEMEDEAFVELNQFYQWDDMDFYYGGIQKCFYYWNEKFTCQIRLR